MFRDWQDRTTRGSSCGLKNMPIVQRSQFAAVLRLDGGLVAFVSASHWIGVASCTVADDRTLSVGALGMVVVLDEGGDTGEKYHGRSLEGSAPLT